MHVASINLRSDNSERSYCSDQEGARDGLDQIDWRAGGKRRVAFYDLKIFVLVKRKKQL